MRANSASAAIASRSNQRLCEAVAGEDALMNDLNQ
jgi:hypothetical protein